MTWAKTNLRAYIVLSHLACGGRDDESRDEIQVADTPESGKEYETTICYHRPSAKRQDGSENVPIIPVSPHNRRAEVTGHPRSGYYSK